MEEMDKTYNVRPGTIDFGREYEYNMVALLSLRCIVQNMEDMWMVSNCDGVGAFDDIILCTRLTGGNNITYMIQLKHKEKVKHITKEEFVTDKSSKSDFSLTKYLNDITKLKERIESEVSGIVKDVGAFSNIYFALFTNRGVYPYEFLEKANPIMSSLVNTNNSDVYKFDFSKLSPGKPNLSAVGDICNRLVLFPNQINAKQVAEEVIVEIRKMFDSLGVTQINAKLIAKDFIIYVTNWARGNFGKHYYLTKQEILHKLSELCLREFEINLSREQFTSYDCPKKLIWNEIVQDEDLILIDSDDTTLQFLFEYIGSEVKKHYKEAVENWADDLCEQDKTSLLQQVDKKFKNQLLKFVGRHGEVSALDIYRCMYLTKRLPLLLKVNKLQDYENILHILIFSHGYFKIIIVNKSGETLKVPTHSKSFYVLQDLCHEAKNKILKLPVKLQGRKELVLLGTLADDEICKRITCRDVINILLNNFNIGNEIKALPEYFIERSVSKVLIRKRVLQHNCDDIFLIEKNLNDVFDRIPIKKKMVFSYEDFDFRNSKGSFIISGLENATRKQKEKIKSTGKNVHYFTVYNTHCLEWKWSLASIDNLIPFKINTHDVFDSDIKQQFSNVINIISAPPGMGKTVLMDCIAYRAPTNKWLLRINLNTNGYKKYSRGKNIHNSSPESLMHLRYFNNLQLNKNNCNTKLVQMVFEKLLSSKNVIVILDGYDEVSLSFKDDVTKIAKCLHCDGYQIWLTTRPHLTSYLENEFNDFSRTLEPFDIYDKQMFITKYFGFLNPDLIFNTKLLKQFISKLLGAAKRNLNDRDAEFTGIPLQCKLLVDVFNDDCKEYLSNNGKSKFNEHFDLLSLYQNLIEKKIDILCEKHQSDIEADMRIMFKHHQSLFAYKLLFPLSCLEGSYVEKLLRDYYREKQSELELLQRDGIIIVDEKLNVSCVHQTFAEYLLARFMSENLRNADANIAEIIQNLLRTRFSGSFTFLYNVFDRILAKDCSSPLKSLHLAIINKNINSIKNAIYENPNIISEVDRCGRSVLHMITLYSARFPFLYDPYYVADKKFKTDGMPAIIQTMSDMEIKKVNGDILGYSSLDYAISNYCLYVASVICDKSNASSANVILHLHQDVRHGYLRYCAELNFKSLFKIMLPLLVSRDLLLSRNFAHFTCTLATYIGNDLITKYNEGLSSKEKISTQITTLKLLQSNIGSPYSGYVNNSYSNLCFAIVLGSKKNVANILRNAELDVNRIDHNLCTPLHYAALHGKPEIVDALLSKGAKINRQGTYSNTALYFAVIGYKLRITDATLHLYLQGTAKDYYDIIVLLVKRGANINIQNLSGATPLHTILNINCGINNFAIRDFNQETKMEHLEIVRLLISGGGDINMPDLDGRTALFIAVENMLDECVIELLNNGADINKTDSEGYSPLQKVIAMAIMLVFFEMGSNAGEENYFRMQNTRENIVRELIARGANINQQNEDGETALHVATHSCELPDCKDLKILLESNKGDVNFQDNNGNTPLHTWIDNIPFTICYNENLIELLLSKNIDVNLQNYDGNTPLHLISERKFSIAQYQLIILLLNRGANINIKNTSRKSVLELAHKRGNFEMLGILYCFVVRQLIRLYPDLILH